MENIVVLGSTGSIGRNTLDIISRLDNYKVIGLSFNRNIDEAKKQIQQFKPQYVCCGKKEYADQLKKIYKDIIFYYEKEGLLELSSLKDADVFVNALVGTSGLMPTYYILKNNKRLALANKESLVVAGSLFRKMADEVNAEIIPIDSEHSAIYQCLENRDIHQVNSILLTASGGPFLDKDNFETIIAKDALNHPTWSMGQKITIDSATMMNKGFEAIEARWLFDVSYDKINIVIHKESIMHSAVMFKDGSIIAQLGAHDMRIPISYALTKPNRLELEFKIDLAEIGSLHFQKPDYERFPTLQLALKALKDENKNLGLILNAADEIAVNYFLNGKIKFTHIFDILKKACLLFEDKQKDNIFEIDKETIFIKNEIIDLIEKDFIGG